MNVSDVDGGLTVLKWLWRLWPFRSSPRSSSQPALTIDRSNVRNQRLQNIYPESIRFVNSGAETAFGVKWDLRRYYDPLLPLSYDGSRGKVTPALGPGDWFVAEFPAKKDSGVADFYEYEVLVWYQDAGRRSFLAHVAISILGRVVRQDHAVGRIGRWTLPAVIWCHHFFPNVWIWVKVLLRPRLLRAVRWIAVWVSHRQPA